MGVYNAIQGHVRHMITKARLGNQARERVLEYSLAVVATRVGAIKAHMVDADYARLIGRLREQANQREVTSCSPSGMPEETNG